TGVIGCSGTNTESQAGSFSIGYNYAFETLGTDVKITFEMLDTDKVGVVAFLWRQSPFTEYQMTNVSGNIFTKTITGQTIGSTINYAVKFAYAGGLSVTRFFSYVVGNNCALEIPTLSESRQLCYPNPVKDVLHLQLLDNHNQISLTDILGKKHLEMVVSAREEINMSDFKPGVYFLKIQNSGGIQHFKIVKN
ncbi:MAG: T9SS type A sorting domain-containing protein, partial [Flavobacterium sp.]|nr:T9SS type A sorting domain-containing protein [Flavobacterium sp.]